MQNDTQYTRPPTVLALHGGFCLNLSRFHCNSTLVTSPPQSQHFLQWRTEGGVFEVLTPPNSEGPPKSCQTQPDCENC